MEISGRSKVFFWLFYNCIKCLYVNSLTTVGTTSTFCSNQITGMTLLLLAPLLTCRQLYYVTKLIHRSCNIVVVTVLPRTFSEKPFPREIWLCYFHSKNFHYKITVCVCVYVLCLRACECVYVRSHYILSTLIKLWWGKGTMGKSGV